MLAEPEAKVAFAVEEAVVTLTRVGFWAPHGWDVRHCETQALSP